MPEELKKTMSTARRPKRKRIQKKLVNEGLLWQEERDLCRALYASIQENHPKKDGEEASSEEEEEEENGSGSDADVDDDSSSNEPASLATSTDCRNGDSVCSCDTASSLEACRNQLQQQLTARQRGGPDTARPGPCAQRQQAETTTTTTTTATTNMCLRNHQDSYAASVSAAAAAVTNSNAASVSSRLRDSRSKAKKCRKQLQQQQQQQQQQKQKQQQLSKYRKSVRNASKKGVAAAAAAVKPAPGTSKAAPVPRAEKTTAAAVAAVAAATRKGLRAKRERKSSGDLAGLKLAVPKDIGLGCSKPKKARLRAQRKFAESLPGSPSTTPAKASLSNSSSSSSNSSNGSSNKGMLFNFCPPTEDFLTFLCLRGTPALPPHLDFFQVAKEHQAEKEAATGHEEEAAAAAAARLVKNHKFVENNFHIPGIEPLPTGLADYPVHSVTRLVSTKKAIRRRKTVASSTQSSIPPSVDVNGNQQLPPCLSPIPPPIAAIPRCRYPPPLTPMEPVSEPAEGGKARGGKAGKQKGGGAAAAVPSAVDRKLPAIAPTSSAAAAAAARVARAKNCTVLKPVLRNGKNRKSSVDVAQPRRRDHRSGLHPHQHHHHHHANNSSSSSGHDDHTKLKTLLKKAELGGRRPRRPKPAENRPVVVAAAVAAVAAFEPPALRNKRKRPDLGKILAGEAAVYGKCRKLQAMAAAAAKSPALKLLRNGNGSGGGDNDNHRGGKQQQCLRKKLRNHVNALALRVACGGKHKAHCANNHHVVVNNNNNNMLKLVPVQPTRGQEPAAAVESANEAAGRPTLVRRGRGRPPGSKNKTRGAGNSSSSSRQPPPAQSTSGRAAPGRPARATPTTGAPGPALSTKVAGATHSAPVFFPSQEEWKDPIAYITSISAQVAPSGMCKVVPPQGWMPECKLKDDMRLTPQMQSVHRFHHRWGTNVQQLACIKKHLAAQDNDISACPPQVGGCELDLVKFSQIVTQLGGRKTLTNKKRWTRVADLLKIPKMIQGRIGKLDGIYCKYLLSYDTLTKEEKEKLCADVEAERKRQSGKRGSKGTQADDSCENVLSRGRSLNLTQYCKMANNFQRMHFKNDPSTAEVEREYWQTVEGCHSHVTVQKADIDTAISGSGFPHRKTDPFGKHNWNLNNIGNNHANLLQALPRKRCINLPEMKVGMLYSTETWNCDRHALPRIEYLHTGAPRIHYCVPYAHLDKVVQAMQTLVPSLCAKKPHCLYDVSFLCMIPPQSLALLDVPVYRLEQRSGEFLVTLPGTSHASISCGYNVAESICYATPGWVPAGIQAFKIASEQHHACEFSMDQLLCLLRTRTSGSLNGKKLLKVLLPELKRIRLKELEGRRRLSAVGLNSSIRFAEPESPSRGGDRRGKVATQSSEEKRCCVCQQICYLSMVLQEKESKVYCLEHALELSQRGKLNRNHKLMYRYDEGQLDKLLGDVQPAKERQSLAKRSSPTRRSLFRKQDSSGSSNSSNSSGRESR